MELEINSIKNSYNLIGALNKTNVSYFLEEIYNGFKTFNELTINIDDLKIIDSHGVNALKKIYNTALELNKEFTIIGIGCKELYDHFESSKAA